MEQYISKSALVAVIKRLLAFYLKEIEDNKENPWATDIAKRDILQEILSSLDTLEVKEVEDLAAADMAEEIIINLKRVENDYHIDLTKQMEWLRNIVKKGE